VVVLPNPSAWKQLVAWISHDRLGFDTYICDLTIEIIYETDTFFRLCTVYVLKYMHGTT
ncbi:hypothetical protein L9F63_019311, partial [Diploptera punctata]